MGSAGQQEYPRAKQNLENNLKPWIRRREAWEWNHSIRNGFPGLTPRMGIFIMHHQLLPSL
jgi:hypothetical protein